MAVIVDFGAGLSADSAVQPRGRGYAERRAASATAAHAGGRAPRAAIDHAHLARYTLGDPELEFEVLQLFAGEAPRTVALLKAAADAGAVALRDWRMGCHTLKGSARAVGAWRVADLAEVAERDEDGGQIEWSRHVVALEAAIADVIAHIGDIRGGANAAE